VLERRSSLREVYGLPLYESGTTHALSVGDVRSHNYMLVLTGESLRQIILAFLPMSLHMQFKTKLYLEWNELLEKSGGLLAKASN
jgi:hypothetical protein